MAAFHFCFMALAVDVIDRCGPSNEMRRQLQPKKTNPSFPTNKTKRFSFKSGCVIQVAKHLKEDWFTVLHQQLWLKTTMYHLKSIIANMLKFKAHLKTI